MTVAVSMTSKVRHPSPRKDPLPVHRTAHEKLEEEERGRDKRKRQEEEEKRKRQI